MSQSTYNEMYAPPCPFTKEGTTRVGTPTYINELKDWMNDAIKQGSTFNAAQRGYKPGIAALNILRGDNNIVPAENQQTDVVLNKIRRVMREIIATQSNIKPGWGYHSTKKEFTKFGDMLTNYLKWWWHTSSARAVFKECMQYAACSSGYLMPYPYRDYVTGEIEIRVRALDFKDVLVCGIPSSMDLQQAYAVIVRLEMPIAEAHETYYHDVDRIKSDRGTASWMVQGVKKARDLTGGLFDWMNARKTEGKAVSAFPTTDVFIAYIRDTSWNNTGKPVVHIENGEARIIQSYTAPDGTRTKIPTGNMLMQDGEYNQETRKRESKQVPEMRLAEKEDCYYFPNRRHIIYVNGEVISDRNFDQWTQGLVPVADFRYDNQPKEFLGVPAIYDAMSLSRAGNRILRAVVDMIGAKLYVPLGIDKSVTDPQITGFNPRAMIQKVIHYSLSQIKNAIVPLIPPDYYIIDGKSLEIMDKLEQNIDYTSGSADMKAIAMARQTPAADTMQKYLEMSGSLATDQSISMELPLQRFGTMFCGLVLQYITTPKLLRIVGYDDVTSNILDYDPSQLVPMTKEGDLRPRAVRAMEFMRQFAFFVTPNSVHELNSMTRQLSMIQLSVKGVPISGRKLYTTFYPEADDYDQIQEEFYKEQKQKAEWAAKIAIAVQIIQKQTSDGIDMATLLHHFDPSQKPGRPSDNTAPPQAETKSDQDGVPRTTVATTPTS